MIRLIELDSCLQCKYYSNRCSMPYGGICTNPMASMFDIKIIEYNELQHGFPTWCPLEIKK